MDKHSNMESRAKSLAKKAHKGQTRNDGITDYFSGHVELVANLCIGEEDRTVAYLHDVVEDTAVTLDDLEKSFPRYIVQSVDRLTKVKEDDEEWDFVNFFAYLLKIKQDPVAVRVKLMDMQCNLSDTPTDKQIAQYTLATSFLIKYKGHYDN